MDQPLLRSPLAWSLVVANLIAVAAVGWISATATQPRRFTLTPVAFDDLPGWTADDPRTALVAFRRSCAALEQLPPGQTLGASAYAGTAGSWRPACAAIPGSTVAPAGARAYFETWFAPVRVGGEAHYTGYYEPELSTSWTRTARFDVPIYGRPSDLVTAELGDFRAGLSGLHIAGRLSGTRLVPYPTRAEIDAGGLATAPVLLYADDPVSVFFLQIQGSGRARFADGETLRLAFAAANGRPYTSVGRVLVDANALERKGLSMQRIRAWFASHPRQARAVMEQDQSYVFFSLAPLGDPALGSPGSEGVALTPGASLAVDARLHPLGAPVFVATTVPSASSNGQSFDHLLVAQDTGGAIVGAARGDIFFGFGAAAESTAGRLDAHGRFYVLLPKAIAAALQPYKEFADAAP